LTGALTGTSATFSGKVLINTVTDVQGALQVNTNGGGLLVNADNSNFAILIRNTSSSNKLWDFSSFNNDFTINEGGVATRMYFQAGGNVGIGTTTPSATLSVVGNATFSSSVTAGDLLSTSYGTARIQVTSTTNSANSGLRYGAKDSAGTAKNAGIYYVAGTTTATTFLSLAANDNDYQFNVLANGNVGIGTTSPSQLLHLRTELGGTSGVGTAIQIESGGGGGDQGWIGVNKGAGNGLEISVENRDIIFNTGATTPFGGSERMRITSGGNVGIGTSSPTTYSLSGKHLELFGGSEYAFIHNNTTTVKSFYAINEAALTAVLFTFSAHPLCFGTGNSEKMRLNSSGDFLVGKTSNSATVEGFMVYNTSTSDGQVFSSIPTAANSYHVYDVSAGTFRFYVSGGGTINATNTTISSISDVRLKENISDLEIGLDAIMALRPRKYDWKPESGNSAKNVRGFIAQEVEAIFPDLIDEWKNEDENAIKYKSLRQDFIPILVKAVQEIKLEKDTEIAELKAQIEELKQLIKNK